jgi:hypothetical protein
MNSIANKKNCLVLKKINELEKKFEKKLSPMILLIVFL